MTTNDYFTEHQRTTLPVRKSSKHMPSCLKRGVQWNLPHESSEAELVRDIIHHEIIPHWPEQLLASNDESRGPGEENRREDGKANRGFHDICKGLYQTV